jgi:hypothetical protein
MDMERMEKPKKWRNYLFTILAITTWETLEKNKEKEIIYDT